ncbi:hypothetical protein M409DRAFT_63831 [Zasmidium cellare ATCC 36951]|uniref:DUF3237 domain-containing protein n=1 Tax=Zasmidium cellare ATCC 36951 TaxID=1080233 RepID=A0A6A6CUJ0_ZASCE|nr:uncharacterized protein M409DRAFT_63831 [Zasmidium cellare ATCC 36951]KAF2170761.1 hypothetical protein M409DRAFT_63831 [Zasmidium cellare ATCC 36951]
MPPSLEHVFTIHGMIQKEHVLQLQTVKGGPQRVVAPIGKGFVKGKDFEAEIVPGGADWMLIDPTTSTAHLDVRLSARTSTSHSLSIHYTGVIKIDEKCAGPMGFDPKAESTRFGDHEWFANPVVETSNPELKWMEAVYHFEMYRV